MAFTPNFAAGPSGNPDLQHSVMPPNTPVNPWVQTPPSIMPWASENRPDLVRFGESVQETANLRVPSMKIKYYKRKSDPDFNIPPPSKVHITEEKMVAQMKNMHIGNIYVDEQGFGNGLDGASNCSLPTLVLSNEVKNLTTYNEPLLPEALVSKINKPTKALVLWRPPAGSLTSGFYTRPQNDSEEEEDRSNNNSTTPDLINMTTSGFGGSTTEMEM